MILGDRRIALPDAMLWITVLGGVIIAVALCFVIIAIIRSLLGGS
jgi:hypothetical protein